MITLIPLGAIWRLPYPILFTRFIYPYFYSARGCLFLEHIRETAGLGRSPHLSALAVAYGACCSPLSELFSLQPFWLLREDRTNGLLRQRIGLAVVF